MHEVETACKLYIPVYTWERRANVEVCWLVEPRVLVSLLRCAGSKMLLNRLHIITWPHTHHHTNTSTHTPAHTHQHTHTHTHQHTHTHTHTHQHTHTPAQTHTPAHTCKHTRTHAYTHTRAHTHTRTHAHTHTRTHAHTHTRTHKLTHARAHTYCCSPFSAVLRQLTPVQHMRLLERFWGICADLQSIRWWRSFPHIHERFLSIFTTLPSVGSQGEGRCLKLFLRRRPNGC